jgi:hypothetical protein
VSRPFSCTLWHHQGTNLQVAAPCAYAGAVTTIPHDRTDSLYATLATIAHSATPDPAAFARAGAELVEVFRAQPGLTLGDVIESIVALSTDDAQRAALLRELAARGLTELA